MSSVEKKLWKIQVAVLATESEVDVLSDALGQAICPDFDHSGSCRIPWFIIVTDGDSLSRRERRDLEELLRTSGGHEPGGEES